VVPDHRPGDYAAQAAAGVDLVLSGHTHGGQFRPLQGLVGRLGQNDNVYGLEQRGSSSFIVTSGISDRALVFKTGCCSEYVMITINPNV